MARANALTKLPRSYYKRRKPVNLKVVQEATKDTTSEQFILGGPGTVAETGRAAFWANTYAKDLLNILRGTHMEATMGAWGHFADQGRLAPEVAIIVDGSVTRPIKHVKVFGEIVIQEPANLGLMYKAVAEAYDYWKSIVPRKDGDLANNLHIFADNTVWVEPELFKTGHDVLNETFGRTQQPPFFTIVNTMPYAAKAERDALPNGLGYATWKKMRGQYGNDLAVRFRYYTDDMIDIAGFQRTGFAYKKTTVTKGRGRKFQQTRSAMTRKGRPDYRERARYDAGKPLSFPAINIGQPGAFNSGASKIIIRAAIQSKR